MLLLIMVHKRIELQSREYKIEITQDTEITAIFIGTEGNSLSTKLDLIHNKPNIRSRINIKAILFDYSRFDIEGILKINKGAKNTDTYLKIDCLVMSDKAFARAVPSLEIKEDDVKGGHGATIGYIDPSQVYYLKSHGLNDKQSEKLITEAFLNI
jgi:Fe-S cluster assembly protein SufB